MTEGSSREPRPRSLALRGPETRRLLLAVCLAVAAIGCWNVAHYPPSEGYDATDHINYALGLVPGGHLPNGRDPSGSEYYTPPGYYALAGSVVWVVEKAGLTLTTAERVASALNVLFLLGTVLLAAALAAALWPGRERIGLGAAAFLALVPVVVENEAMFHPEMLALFLSTLALWLCARVLAGASRSTVVALGVVLGLAQLVLAPALWAVGCVVAALLVARRLRALLVVVVLAAAIPAPWYVHQSLTYGGLPFFAGRPPTAQAHTRSGAVKPLYDRQPPSFYVDPGLPGVVTGPYQPHFADDLVPMTYTGLWGDYQGAWAWIARPRGGYGTETIFPPPRSARRRLTIQALVGLLPTLVALGGFLLLLRGSLRDARRLLVALLPLVGLLSYLAFAVDYPTGDGGTLKTAFMLTTVPCWALGFGLALDRLGRRLQRPAVALLALCALVDLTFVVYR